MAEEITVKWLLQELQRLETEIVVVENSYPTANHYSTVPEMLARRVDRRVKEKLAVWQCLATVQVALISIKHETSD